MYLKNYLYMEKIPINFCDRVVNFALNRSQSLGRTGLEEKTSMKKRNSFVVWLDEPWILRCIYPFIKQINKKADWNFTITGVEPLQFTKYVGSLKQHYDWHQDSGEKHEDRKLSFVIQLSDPETYVGGQFLINPSGIQSKKTIKFNERWSEKGTIIFFPSFYSHTVTPVFKGTRYSLVGWCTGPKFT